MSVEIHGLSDTRAALKQWGIDIDKAVKEAVLAAAVEVAELSEKYVPVATGRLRDSLSVEVKGDAVEISYDAPYAAEVHERTEAGGAKFLERALHEEQNDFAGKIIKHLERLLS